MLTTLNNLAAELGWTNAALYTLARALHMVSGGKVRLLKYMLIAQPVGEQDLTPARRGRSIEVYEASADEVLATNFGRPQPVIKQRLNNGCRCLLARRNGQLVGFQWFTTRDYPEDEVRCDFTLHPGDNCAWDFDIFVMPEARTQPVFTRLWDTCNATLRAEGISLTLSRINAFNSASVRAHRRMGARSIGSAVFVLAGNRQLSLLPTPPRVHLSTNEGNRSRIPISRLARRKKYA